VDVALSVYANAKSISIGGGSAVSLDVSRSSALDIAIMGAASLNGAKPFTLDAFSLTIDGAASFEASGTATTANYNLNGTGVIKAKDLLSDNVKINLDGTGNAVVTANKTLDVAIDGTGNVTYYGEPVLTQSINGLGSITKGN
jgi:hypothetical protein